MHLPGGHACTPPDAFYQAPCGAQQQIAHFHAPAIIKAF